MELKWFSIIILFLVACTGGGTEVVNTPNPNETPPTKKFETQNYTVLLDIPEGWTFIDYTTGIEPGEEAFTDVDEETETVAHFSYTDRGFFTIFAARLDEGETLIDYARNRHPSGDIELTVVESEEGQKGNLAFVDQEEVGPRGGYVFDVYLEVESEVLWMRTELLGTGEEMQATWNQFWEIVGSAEIE